MHNLITYCDDNDIPTRYLATGGGWDWIEIQHPDQPHLKFWIGWADPEKRAHWFDDGDRTYAECIDLARAELVVDVDCDPFSLGFQSYRPDIVADGWVAFVGLQFVADPDMDDDDTETVGAFTATLDAEGWDPIICKAFRDGPMLAQL